MLFTAAYASEANSLCYVFIRSQLATGFRNVGSTFVDNWLREDYGHGTHEYTMIAPHKTDASAECAVIENSLNLLKLSLRHHAVQ